jgi:hypothetical protein
VPDTRLQLRRWTRSILLFGLVGVFAGTVAKAADESGIGWANDLGSYPAVWVLAVASIGRAAPDLPQAAVRSAAFFAAMTVGYYSWAAEVLHFGWQPGLLTAWLVLSGTAVPATAVAVWWATRRAGVVPGAMLAFAGALATTSGAVNRLWYSLTGDFPAGEVQPVQVVADLVTVLVVVVLLPRHRSTRLWGLVLLLPMIWVAGRLIEVFHQVVP